MIFNSIEFLIFFCIIYLLYRLLPFRWQNRMLLVASYIFYGWWDRRFLFLIILSTSFDFATALMIGKGKLTNDQRIYPSVAVILAALFFITNSPISSFKSISSMATDSSLSIIGLEHIHREFTSCYLNQCPISPSNHTQWEYSSKNLFKLKFIHQFSPIRIF